MAKTEFSILPVLLKHVPPSVFPVSVNVTITYQFIQTKTQGVILDSSPSFPSVPQPYPSHCHLSLGLSRHLICLHVAPFGPSRPVTMCNLSDELFNDTNMYMQVMPSFWNPSVASRGP